MLCFIMATGSTELAVCRRREGRKERRRERGGNGQVSSVDLSSDVLYMHVTD